MAQIKHSFSLRGGRRAAERGEGRSDGWVRITSALQILHFPSFGERRCRGVLVTAVVGACGAAVGITFEGDGTERCDFVIPLGEGFMFHVEAVTFVGPDEAFL